MPDPSPAPVLVLVRDLLLTSRVTAAARSLQVPVQVIRDARSLAPTSHAPLLLADLNLDGAIDAASAWLAADGARRAVGFVSHVDAPTIARAKQAGLTDILPRSRFFETLDTLLRGAGDDTPSPDR